MKKPISYKSLVRKQYPEAEAIYYPLDDCWRIFSIHAPGSAIIGSGKNAKAAWKNAWEQIRREK